MAKLTIGGREFELAPYKLGSLEKAAPFIDRINGRAGSLATLEGLTASAADIVAVLSIGLVKIDATLTADALKDMVGFEDLPALRDAFTDLLAEAGMKPAGEAKAPAPKAAGASRKRSKT